MNARVNLVQGIAAGGLLRQACRHHGVPGDVAVIDDELGVGPLSDDGVRSAWWREVSTHYTREYEADIRPYAQFDKLKSATGVAEIVLWCGDNHDDYVFLRMAVACLGWASRVSIVELPFGEGLPHVGMRHPDQLATFESLRRTLSDDERATREQEFNSIRTCAGVRVLTDAGLALRGDDDADQEIWEASRADWKKVAYVVGGAMSARDRRNRLGDMFLRWRVRGLVAGGRFEHRGESWFVEDRTSEIRRAS